MCARGLLLKPLSSLLYILSGEPINEKQACPPAITLTLTGARPGEFLGNGDATCT